MLAGRIVKEQSDTARFNVDLTAASSLFPSYLNGEGGTAPWLGTETAAAISTPTVVLGSGSWSTFPPPTTAPADPSPVTVQSASIVAGTELQLFIVSGTPGNSYTITTVVSDTAGRKLTVEVGVQIAGQVTLAPAPVPNATLALPIGGGTLLGPLYLFEDPLTGKEASTKAYVDKQFQNGLFISGITVTGGAQITGNSKVTGTLETTGALTIDAGGAQVTGNSKVTGTLETTGALTVDAGGAQVTGNSKVTGTLETTGALTVDAGGAAITGNVAVTGALSGAIRNFLSGMTLSNDGGTPNTILDVAAGQCADSTNATLITLGTFTKTTAGAWVSGTGNAGMGQGLTVGNNTWYHVFAIIVSGVADVYFDTSVSAANKPASTTAFRRIGSFKTDGSAHIKTFSQNGDEFLWLVPVLDVNGVTPLTTAVLATLSVPLGVKTNALFRGSYGDTTSSTGILFSSPDETDNAPGAGGAGLSLTSPQASVSFGSAGSFNVRTNTSSQVRYRATGTTTNTINVFTYGYVDTRGKG